MKTKSRLQIRILLGALLFLNALTVFSQNNTCPDNLLVNGDFNTASCGGNSAFQTNCVTNWSAAAQSPSLFGYPSNPYAWMWSTQGVGEAIDANFNFVTGVTYDISFRVSATDGNIQCENTGTTSIINFIATNTTGAVTASPGGEVIFQSNSGPYLNTWSTVTVSFTPTVNASKLWVFPYQGATNCRIDLSIDDICITEANVISEDGAYCCESENFITNGNFEFGDQDFSSSYTQDATTLPGYYDVTDDASLFGATITDHSFCADPTAYATHDNFLLVNGKTTQPAGTTSVIWQQTLNGLDLEKEYRFCGNFKNMPQCTFDIKPQILIETSNGFSHTATINVDPLDPCAWQLEGFCFDAEEQMSIRISVLEDGLGDGNDLAIDDISVSVLRDPELSITVQHQGTPQQIAGSINTIDTADDVLPFDTEICEEPWYWFVATVDSFSAGVYTIDFAQSYGWGNDTGYSLFNPGTSGATPWDLTTNYPNFPFAQNTLYIVGMYTNSCCEDCVDEGFTYQITLNRSAIPTLQETGVSASDKERIIGMLGTYASTLGTSRATGANAFQTSRLNVSPNPAKNLVTVRIQDNSLNKVLITSMTGNTVKDIAIRNNATYQEINVEGVASGMYLVKATATDGSVYTTKLIIE